MEIIEIDHAEMDTIKEEIISKLPFFKIGETGSYLQDALSIVNGLAASNQTRWLDNVSTAHRQICEQRQASVPNVSPYMRQSDLLWAYVCLMSYYLYASDDIWRKHVLPRMERKLRHPRLKAELEEAKNLINKEDQANQALLADIFAKEKQKGKSPEEQNNPVETQHLAQIKDFETKLSQKEEEIAKLNSRIKELEARLNVVHLSFIETEGKNPEVIKCVYIDIKKATIGPAEMAECLHDLHIRGLLKNQERYKKMKNIKKIHKELQETYHFEWSYDALRRALNRKTAKK